MADIKEMTVTVELKEGIFLKLIEYRIFKLMLSVLPYRWVKWLIAKSLKYRIGKHGKWHSFSRDLII